MSEVPRKKSIKKGGAKKKKKATLSKKLTKSKKKSDKKDDPSGAEPMEVEEDVQESQISEETVQAIKRVKTTLPEFRAALQKDHPELFKCQQLLTQLKLDLIHFQLIPPFTGNINAIKEQLELARSVWELACSLSIKSKDYKSFERHVAQVKTFYTDFEPSILEPSEAKWQILGLNLLGLLAYKPIEAFYTELELIPVELWDNLYISYPLQIEQRLMEGNYNKVLRARKNLPMPDYEYFADMLVKTVREKISDCTEKSYESVPLEDARQMLMLESQAELAEHIRKRDWEVHDGSVVFAKKDKVVSVEIPSHTLIKQTLQYATDLERIV